MIDSLTIVIQLTGLLMLVPPSPGQSGPTRVLMPEPDHIRHEAVLAYRNPAGHACSEGILVSGEFCFVRMEGWELDPLPGRARSVNLPRTIMNLTRNGGGIRVHRNLLASNPPRDSLRARFTLGGGDVSGACPMGRWTFDPVGAQQRDTISLANVVEWTIPDVPQDSIVLVRRRLSGGSAQKLVTLYPERGRIELLIAHVPPGALIKFQRLLSRLARHSGRTPAAKLAPAGGHLASTDDTRIDHFGSYYRLFDRAQDRRLPSYDRTVDSDGCPLSIWLRAPVRSMAPTTVNCMVVAGFQ